MNTTHAHLQPVNSSNKVVTVIAHVPRSHSNTPVDELLGKPYQDEMLALIESYQDKQDNKDDIIADGDDNDEFDETEQS